mmetsp:Transcript_152394/g.265632  ORF Transcript_152394/g.265632 Transcript_152394/m.265632 type:complete len:137 (-) Transcript_152394:40-450(-)
MMGFAPGQIAGYGAFSVLLVSVITKFYMSFVVRTKAIMLGPVKGEEYLMTTPVVFASKTQLNVAEYDALLMVCLMFMYFKQLDSVLVTIVSITMPVSQLVFFTVRLATGSGASSPAGALPRYISLILSLIIIFNNI